MEHVTTTAGVFETGFKEFYDHIIEDISPQDTPQWSLLGEAEIVDSVEYETYSVDLCERDGTYDIARTTGVTIDDIDSSDEDALRMVGYMQIYFEFVQIDSTAESNRIAPPINSLDKKTARKLINMKQNYETRGLNGVYQRIHEADAVGGVFMGAPGIISLWADQCNGGTRIGTDSPNVITAISSFADTAPDAIGGETPADTQEVLDIVLNQRWDDGGDPNYLIVKGSDKRAIAAFDTSGATRTYESMEEVVNNVEIYKSPVGDKPIIVMASRAYAAYGDDATDAFDTKTGGGDMIRDFALLFNPKRWKKTTLINHGWRSKDVSPRGLNNERFITAQVGLRCYNSGGDAIFCFTAKTTDWSNPHGLPTTANSYTIN